MTDPDPSLALKEERARKIQAHDDLRNTPEFKAQQVRCVRLMEGAALGLHSTWLMASRCQSLIDDFLTFRFVDDTLQSIISIWALANEGLHNPARREMRYLLEAASKHLYVDLKLMHANARLSEKIAFLESTVSSSSVAFVSDMTLYGFDVAQNKEFIDEISSTYSRLCQYVHRSPEQVSKSIALLSRGISPGFDTAQEFEALNQEITQLYDLVLVMHFNALGLGLAGDLFVSLFDGMQAWPYHRTKHVARVSRLFDYKFERQKERNDA